jgi:hypothetical protein
MSPHVPGSLVSILAGHERCAAPLGNLLGSSQTVRVDNFAATHGRDSANSREPMKNVFLALAQERNLIPRKFSPQIAWKMTPKSVTLRIAWDTFLRRYRSNGPFCDVGSREFKKHPAKTAS